MNIDNPKDLFYFPQKVMGPHSSIPKSIPKLNFQEKEETLNTKVEDIKEEQDGPQHVEEEYGTFQSNALDKAFMTNDSIAISEKKVCIDELNIASESKFLINY
jgi:hypothetical protein